MPSSPAIEAKAHAWLAKLTLEQKIELIGGVDDMYTHAAPAIDLPRFKMSDASVGVRTWGPTTAYAGGVALAATWDRDFARKLGEALGKDARARSVNFLLGPGVNIARSPVAGRNFEYLSEDPYLNSILVVPYIQGVQSQGVIATVKHYALNDQEYNRHNVSSDVDERTMREIYLPSFEAAVTKGHVDAVMNSYNLINGVHATQNEFLNLKLLKDEWGFQGILMSDWDATYDTVGAANNGLDLEMPSPRFMNARALLAAVKDGSVTESTIDDKVLRLFRTELRYGFPDRPQFDPADSTYSVADRAVALEGARESITLLKNEGHLLPLVPARVKTIAVIGPDAWPAVTGGGGSSEAQAFEPVSTVTGIANLVGPNVHVLYSRGLPEMNDVFQGTHWEGGVKVATYPSKDFTGTPETTTPTNIADYKPEWWGPEDKTPRSIRYTTSFKAAKTGEYLILAAASGNDDFTIHIDGKPLLSPPHVEGQAPQSWTIDLNAGQTVNVVADYLPGFVGVRFGLGIAFEPDLIAAEVKTYAAAADVVVVAVGFNTGTESEGLDRTFELPWGQDALIEAVAAANPHTIVTLTGGGGADTRRWLAKV
ncbi:MAG TPA: glycoside hydrolase family 3 N-terminal domain-containing protein, partial [Terracidiphilus sp.]